MTEAPSSTTANLRLFCAIDVPPAVSSALASAQHELKRALQDSRVTWSRPDAIHLTLVFLGDVAASQVPQVSDSLGQICRVSHSMHLRISGPGCFPNPHHPRVMWIGVDDPEGGLATLAAAIRAALLPWIAKPDARPFHPHLTLGRIKHLAGHDGPHLKTWLAAASVPSMPWPVTTVKLYSSQPSMAGSKYSALAEHPLGGE